MTERDPTDHDARFLPLGGTLNLRDLGGLPLAGGGTTPLFHCTAGKDRTGLRALLVLEAASTPRPRPIPGGDMEHTPTLPTDGAAPRSAEQRLFALRRRHAIDELPLANWRATAAGGAAVEIAEGDPWPTGADRVTFDRHTATIPAAWPLGDVRLDLDVGGDADVILHSRHGPETHRVAKGGSALKPPTRAFGIRIEAHALGGAPRLGATRLILVDPELGDALGRLEGELDPAARERGLTELERRSGGAGPAAGAPHGGAAPT